MQTQYKREKERERRSERETDRQRKEIVARRGTERDIFSLGRNSLRRLLLLLPWNSIYKNSSVGVY